MAASGLCCPLRTCVSSFLCVSFEWQYMLVFSHECVFQMSRFCRLAPRHTGLTGNVFLGLAPCFPVGACSSTCAVLPSNLIVAHPDLPNHANWRTSTKPPGLSSFAAYPATFAPEVGSNSAVGTHAFGGHLD